MTELIIYTTSYPATLQNIIQSTTLLSPEYTAQLHNEIQSNISQINHILPIQLSCNATKYQLIDTINELIQLIANSQAVYGILPCENSESGSFRSVYEQIKLYKLFINGEFAITNNVYNTNEWLATRYIIISKQSCNMSRLIQQSNQQLKSTAIMRISHQPGAVYKILSCFALRDVNVLKFQGLPIRSINDSNNNTSNNNQLGMPDSLPRQQSTDRISSLTNVLPVSTSNHSFLTQQWEYQFLVDYEPSKIIAINQSVDNALKEFSIHYHSLGTYCQNLTPLTDESTQQQQDKYMLSNSAYA